MQQIAEQQQISPRQQVTAFEQLVLEGEERGMSTSATFVVSATKEASLLRSHEKLFQAGFMAYRMK